MKNISTLVIATFIFVNVIPQTVMARQQVTETNIGIVTDVSAITRDYTRRTPSQKEICRTHDVPVYGSNKGGNEIGGLIIGGLLGSAAGNQLTGADGAGTLGAVAGALIGRDVAKNKTTTNEIVGYRQENICETQTVYTSETIQEVTGYRLTVSIDGQEFDFKSKKPYDIGDDIFVRTRTTYSLR